MPRRAPKQQAPTKRPASSFLSASLLQAPSADTGRDSEEASDGDAKVSTEGQVQQMKSSGRSFLSPTLLQAPPPDDDDKEEPDYRFLVEALTSEDNEGDNDESSGTDEAYQPSPKMRQRVAGGTAARKVVRRRKLIAKESKKTGKGRSRKKRGMTTSKKRRWSRTTIRWQ
jgi:hypothetical protein